MRAQLRQGGAAPQCILATFPRPPPATSRAHTIMLLMQVVPILRAGLILMEQAATLLPVTQTYHVGYVRDDQTLEVCADAAAACYRDRAC